MLICLKLPNVLLDRFLSIPVFSIVSLYNQDKTTKLKINYLVQYPGHCLSLNFANLVVSFAIQEAAFRHAIDLVNADRNVLVRSRLTAHIEKIPHGDSFRASQKGN